jgi:L-fucose mutarotase/ribose pyranase (RbsD/FucU family)
LSALNFNRHIVGKLSGRFLKTLIERGHGSEVNILKRANENQDASPS